MSNLKKISNNENKFTKDPFYDLLKLAHDPIYFNVKIPPGEKNFMNQPKSKQQVKQSKIE